MISRPRVHRSLPQVGSSRAPSLGSKRDKTNARRAPKLLRTAQPPSLTENRYITSKLSSDMQENTHKERKASSQLVLSRMQLKLHTTRQTPYSASRLVHAMSASSVKVRHAPSRHCRDLRVSGLKTTAMHEMSTPPPPPPWQN